MALFRYVLISFFWAAVIVYTIFLSRDSPQWRGAYERHRASCITRRDSRSLRTGNIAPSVNSDHTLRRLRYLEAGSNDAVATCYDPLLDNEPALACTMAASVKQRIAFGKRAGQKVRRIGSGCGYAGAHPALTGPRCASVGGFALHATTQIPAPRRDQLERLMRYTARGAVALARRAEDAHGDRVSTCSRPWSDGTTGMKLSPLELLEKLAAVVPLSRAHRVRYAGCVAPQSQRRDAIIPTPRQQGVDGHATRPGTPRWSWARRLGRGCDLALATCP